MPAGILNEQRDSCQPAVPDSMLGHIASRTHLPVFELKPSTSTSDHCTLLNFMRVLTA